MSRLVLYVELRLRMAIVGELARKAGRVECCKVEVERVGGGVFARKKIW